MSTFTEQMEVAENYDGWRLDQFLVQKIRRTSRTKVQRYIRSNVTIMPPRRVKPSMRVRTGDVVIITRRERIMPHTPGVEALRVLRRWDDVAVVDKPAGILVHRTSREVSHTLESYLDVVFSDSEHAEATHRLDRETSGCVICALTPEAVSAWRERFHRREIDKRYLAIVDDEAERWAIGATASIDIPLGISEQSKVGLAMGRGPLSARTDVFCHARAQGRALLELRLHDGRQHQIRVHLKLCETPIVGDKLYGVDGEEYFMRYYDDPESTLRDDPPATTFHCLHAWRIRFERDGQKHDVAAPLPAHMRELLSHLNLQPPRESASALD